MEQHAMPRNITGFQFRLVGDMTLKQFGYLAGGGITAYLIFKTAPFPPIVTITLAVSIALIGAAFAFLPIQERPLDKWLAAFVKSITSPTQFVWRKQNPPLDILINPHLAHVVSPKSEIIQNRDKEAKEKLQAYLATIPAAPHETLNAYEKKFVENTISLFNLSKVVVGSTPVPPVSLPNQPVPKPIPPHIEKPQVPHIQKPVLSDKPAPSQVMTPHPTVSPSPATVPPVTQMQNFQKQLSQLANEKQKLEQELYALKQMLTKAQQPESRVVKPVPAKEATEPTVKMVSTKTAATMPNQPEGPNIILGVIQDMQKRLLPNIIVTIKDKNGLPLRALKTNKLGQFEIATPLPNGTYRLEMEDPLKRFVFDIAEISLSGKILLPIEITAKGEKELMREKLTKELFGNTI
jgi:hypothetical protein